MRSIDMTADEQAAAGMAAHLAIASSLAEARRLRSLGRLADGDALVHQAAQQEDASWGRCLPDDCWLAGLAGDRAIARHASWHARAGSRIGRLIDRQIDERMAGR